MADVYKAGRLAATLTRSPHGTTFSYLPEYLSSGLSAVATTLPLADTPVHTAAGAVPPFFAGLLPEGRRLTSLRLNVKASADDELSLLLAVGGDAVGDVQVVSAGTAPEPVPPLIQVDRSFSEVIFEERLTITGVIDRVALAGVQDKASAGMISVPAQRAGRRYLLKVDPPEYPGVVLDEAFFLALASEAGLRPVRWEVVHDATGRPGLLIERFDRTPGPDRTTIALPVEDGAQVLGLYPADKYNVTAETVVTALAAVCPARAVALRALFAQLCFAWLTGNGDVHAKNLAVLATPEGEWRVAPAYDLPSTLPYRDTTMALAMGGRTAGLSRRSLLDFAADVGLPARSAISTLDQVLTSTANLEERLVGAQLPFTAQQLRSIARAVRQRRRTALP